ncbi:hypothetical protein DFP94_1227 [Fontibacillus phaseoli]|uniref:D-lyxose ketol-isomerase n=1 Tax=Fontibacillus phaseoli TaxID=1416533 RepID=A0A369AUM1_9BACL|nr:D-lyxose/D-mannose family sugar isomerase [Fontibacillus phaseoli]RCX13029.1 hypothetical protein DFP94_1227 [Fontibacillus phaseoli]
MISKKQFEEIKEKVLGYLAQANIAVTKEEIDLIEVADFGLNDIYNNGLQLLEYVNTSRVCAKELVMLPGQTCPEHRHPPFGDYRGKEETFRCRYGKVHLFVEGEATTHPQAQPPEKGKKYFTVQHEIILHPGDQYTIPVDTLHWFKAGENGAVITEFSTTSYDDYDIFTNPEIKRIPVVE